MPTDRLVAEWHLTSERVVDVLQGKEPVKRSPVERVEIVLGKSPPEGIAETQAQARQRFQELFAKGYEVTWFERIPGGGAYILEPQK
jgi:predicted GNAT superfamily acetyltransferase